MHSDNYYIIPLLSKLLKTAGASFNVSELAFALESHPFYPAISAVSQALTYVGVKNRVYRADYEGILKMASLALVHFNREGNRFLLLWKATDKDVCCYEAEGNRCITFSKEDFLRQWSGKVLYITGSTLRTAYPVAVAKSFRNGLAPGLFVSFLFVSALSFFAGRLYFFSLLLLKIAGCTICLEILRHESGEESGLAALVCRSSSSFDCGKVLASSASRLFRVISLAEAGMLYFILGGLALTVGYMAGYGQAVTVLLFYVSLSSLPFVVFSVFYQGKILGKWCPLCLSVAGILVTESFLFSFYPVKYFPFPESRLIEILVFTAVIAGIITFLAGNGIRQSAGRKREEIAVSKLKRHPAVVMALFRQQPLFRVADEPLIILGNKEAEVSVTTVIHPFCRPCNRTARTLCNLLERFPDRLKWEIRFDGIESDTLHPGNEVQLYLSELYRKLNDPEKYFRIWKHWLEHPSLNTLLARYPLEEISSDTISRLRFQIVENKKAGVGRLPYVVVNDRIMPENYAVSDIGYLLCDGEVLHKVTSRSMQEIYI